MYGNSIEVLQTSLLESLLDARCLVADGQNGLDLTIFHPRNVLNLQESYAGPRPLLLRRSAPVSTSHRTDSRSEGASIINRVSQIEVDELLVDSPALGFCLQTTNHLFVNRPLDRSLAGERPVDHDLIRSLSGSTGFPFGHSCLESIGSLSVEEILEGCLLIRVY